MPSESLPDLVKRLVEQFRGEGETVYWSEQRLAIALRVAGYHDVKTVKITSDNRVVITKLDDALSTVIML